jgi:hypothetical protein
MTLLKLRQTMTALLLVLGGTALAGPVPAGLSITGTVTLDTTNSYAAVGDASQSGSFSATSAGAVVGTSTFGNDPTAPAPSASQSAALTATGDGIGATLQMSGSASTNGANQTDGLFVDYLLSLVNGSATDTFDVTFRVDWTNTVVATGSDAFAHGQLSVFDESNAEVFYTDITADTVNGGADFYSGGDTFTVSLAPGASYTLTALQQQRGGAFIAASSYNAFLAAYLVLDNVDIVGQPPTGVPLPGTLPLFALGVALLAGSRRRR